MLKALKNKWSQARMKIRGWIEAALQGTHNHYSCYLPGNISAISSFFLKLLYTGIRVEKDQKSALGHIPKDAIVVYTTKYKSKFEYLFYHTRYRQDGLPYPNIGLDINVYLWQSGSRILRMLFARLDYYFQRRSFPGPYSGDYIKEALMNGRVGLLSLVGQKGFYRRFVKAKTDPLQYLIEMQKKTDRPIYIIPQLMFFGTKPHRSVPSIIDILFGTEQEPGNIRRLVTLFKHPGKVFVEISEPLILNEYLELMENQERSIEQQASVLRRDLLVQINRHRQSITGPILKSKDEMKENILTSDRMRTIMQQYSEKRDIPIYQVHKEAEAYLEEIGAKYNVSFIKVAAAVVRWLIKTIFEDVTVNTEILNRIKSMSKKGPLILIPCHKSHLDYLILPYILFNNNMPAPHVVAGKNLFFWPAAPLLRAGGAFSLRRTFKGAVFYSKVFAEYVHWLLEEGFNIKIYIEGGRSRTGKLMMPQLGFLSILLNAYKKGACDDMIFVPVFIGYDRVVEESSYLHEVEGGQKESENLWQIIKARKFLKKKYGSVYVKFQEPMSLNEMLSRTNASLKEMPSKEQNTFCRNLGHRMTNAINRATIVTPHAVVASAILNSSQKNFSYTSLMYQIEIYMTYLFSQKAMLADTLIVDPVHAVENALDSYIQRKFVERTSKNKSNPTTNADAMFQVNESKRLVLEYYKNNCAHFFIPAAFTALAILKKDAFQFSASDLHADYTFLQDFFKYEFVHDIERTPEYFVRKNIKVFIDDAMLMPHPTLPDTYNLTSEGYRKLKLFASFLKSYFESYWIVLKFFTRNPSNSIKSKDRLKKIQARGNRMYKSKEIERKEAISKINFKNAVNYFTSQNLKGSEDTEKIEFFTDSIQKYLTHLPS
jgi:glycerol-3-phosphate O-acyltransferase